MQEINVHRYEKKPAPGRFLGSDMNLYESTHESIGVPFIPTNGQMTHQTMPVNPKLLVRKQADQFNTHTNGVNNNNNRFTYSTVK